MGCPSTPLSCLDPTSIYAGFFNKTCGGFGDPSKFQAERTVFNTGFLELINNFGVEIDYYVNTYNLSSANNFYGEEPTAPFYGPIPIKAYVEYEQSGVPLQVYGWEPDDSITMYIHIDGFYEAFSVLNVHSDNGQRVEPKADDGFILTPFGCDRAYSRPAKRFVITEVIDEDGSSLNPMGGHYIWKITAKRFDSSFEAGFQSKDGDDNQVYDNTFSGIVSSSIIEGEGLPLQDENGNYIVDENDDILTTDSISEQLSSFSKRYDFDVDEYVKDNIFDNRVNDTSIYGEYY